MCFTNTEGKVRPLFLIVLLLLLHFNVFCGRFLLANILNMKTEQHHFLMTLRWKKSMLQIRSCDFQNASTKCAEKHLVLHLTADLNSCVCKPPSSGDNLIILLLWIRHNDQFTSCSPLIGHFRRQGLRCSCRACSGERNHPAFPNIFPFDPP